MPGKLITFLSSLFKDKVTGLAAAAFILSVALSFMIWALLAGTISISGGSFSGTLTALGPLTSLGVASLFVISFFIIWFILHIQYIREAEDIYSRLRTKIAGVWLAEYDWLIAGKYLFPNRPKAFFEFAINADRKLEMQFDPKDNILFSDVDQDLSQISLRHIQGNKYNLTYYYKNERKLRSEYKSNIEPDYLNHNVLAIDIEVFGILTFEEPKGTSPVVLMKGEWFDLNGNMKVLGTLLNKKTEAELRQQASPFRAKLSTLVPEHLASARMGEVEFRRQAPTAAL